VDYQLDLAFSDTCYERSMMTLIEDKRKLN